MHLHPVFVWGIFWGVIFQERSYWSVRWISLIVQLGAYYPLTPERTGGTCLSLQKASWLLPSVKDGQVHFFMMGPPV